MSICPFCHRNLVERETFCSFCGYPLVLALPFRPEIEHKSRYLVLAFLSLFFGIASSVFSFHSYLYIVGLVFVIPSIAFGGICLEAISQKFNGTLIRYVAIAGLALGVFSYVISIFTNSNVPGNGYSM
jgi:FtsH-binding integral membrane protein